MRRPKARQCAALPCRRDADGALSVLLITSRETRRWVAPKGWPMPERGSAGTAAREAFEEAGVLGVVSSPAIGRYVYEKRLSPKRAQRVEVEVHRLDVIEELAEWPERSQRTRRWFTVREAAEAVEEEGLAALILAIA
ncbi:MAG: NUDIX domain-containing protein [Rhodobacteraceae bacterium]|nr:MAG: NUDIX domain-containing protein [Paracoccaceae bacterium]